MNALFLIVIGSLCGLANALTIPLSAREPHFARPRHLPMRLVGMQSISQTSGDDVINFYDTVYATNMTIGGQDLLIQLDTGSSDLWVSLPSGQFEFTNVTDITAQETYGIGAVTGTIAFANASLGDHFVYNQAFINATNATDFGTIFGDNVRGILGLSFDAGSTVDVDVVEAFGANSTAGVSFLVNLFLQNPSMSHFFTTQLGRTDDPQYTMEGFFTIGDYVPGLEAVAQQPELARFPNSSPTGNPPRWSTVMNGMTVNGESFAFNASGVPGTPNGSVVAVLDTGFTFPPIPEEAVTFIYSSIEGAYFDNNSSLWIVPCENATQLEFQFENMSVPIHPLDLTTVVELNNQTVCVNTFRATTFPVNDQFDIILGDAFLKNVYASFNYGNWSASDPDAIPYIQLLPTTNLTAAFDEFAQVRSAMVTSAEASASMSATASIMPSATSAASGSSDSVLPTTSVLYSSAWSTYPASSAWSSYASASSASSTWSSAAPTASVSADSNSSSTNTSASATTDPTDPSANSTDTSANATESAADSFTITTTVPGPSVLAAAMPSTSAGQLSAADTSSQAALNSRRRRHYRRSVIEPSRTVTDCLAPLIEHYGAILFALLGGSFIISLALCIVSVVIAMRNHARSQARRRAVYSVMETKTETETDPEGADALSATYYYNP